jgi:3-methyladenine DNA glycosylase AlkC
LAEPLKNQFGADVPVKIAGMISAVFHRFPAEAFVRDAIQGYEALDLMQRGKKIASAMRQHLPDDYIEAAEVLIASLGPKLVKTEDFGMWSFLYLPHTMFVAEHGIGHFEMSMRAQYELTQRFTAEFSIRPFLERYPEATLTQLATWAEDPSPHVRRLVSEGTRPRLPWASRLRDFQKDPSPVLSLLELLKDDVSLYVRRSVANNLNDIGKDHPDVLVVTARRWMKDASEERRWLIRHALRSALKRGEAGALEVMGFGEPASVSVAKAGIEPKRPVTGDDVTISFEIANTAQRAQNILVDLCIHFVKANGKTSPKVFKLKTVKLAPQEATQLKKTISLAEMTTRKHYVGTHKVEVLLNGNAMPMGAFELSE